ncbi:hypothetical protein [Pseudomonas sp. BBP2017]|uniref:hypothetical protein n=1 Tax=Pseudomonas sp. BBP2017 TaxID=2109731 RepID=UPI000D12F0CC|nr:hypothetical protein [Pseudomonas sp. BBP2017]PSS57767.1 hypothetical protein C6382_07695 [Pseudomonas sp. BBP2017]
MNTRPRCTAFHEAGHVLAFWWNGQRIKRVTVRTRAEALIGPMVDLRGNLQAVKGLVEADYLVPLPAFEPPGIAEHLPSMISAIERDLVDCFAGPMAEAIYRHCPVDRCLQRSGAGDRQRGMELIRLLPARMVLEAEPLAIARASCLVHRYWAVVSAVAQYLHAQGTVNGEDISALLCQLSGESPTPLGNLLSDLDTRHNRHATTRLRPVCLA